jgi:hypothetical protein
MIGGSCRRFTNTIELLSALGHPWATHYNTCVPAIIPKEQGRRTDISKNTKPPLGGFVFCIKKHTVQKKHRVL